MSEKLKNQHYPVRQNSYSYEDLMQCARGELFGPGNAQLPAPNMLMVDRIVSITEDGGEHQKGFIHAQLDINPKLWFFDCHFIGDPVMPGCLGLDALWQLTGFYLGWMGAMGRGRALGLGELKFTGEILNTTKLVRYEIHYKRIIMGRLVLGQADGYVFADDTKVYEARDMKVGLFVK